MRLSLKIEGSTKFSAVTTLSKREFKSLISLLITASSLIIVVKLGEISSLNISISPFVSLGFPFVSIIPQWYLIRYTN